MHRDAVRVPTSAEACENVMEVLSPIDGITSRKMMGEYILYYRGRLFGGIYDDSLMVKVTPSSARMLSGRETVPPVRGCQEHDRHRRCGHGHVAKAHRGDV